MFLGNFLDIFRKFPDIVRKYPGCFETFSGFSASDKIKLALISIQKLNIWVDKSML